MKWFLLFLVALTAPAFAKVSPGPDGDLPKASCAYPAAALEARAEGTTKVVYFGSKDGEITRVLLTQSSGNRDLDMAVGTCITEWRFRPDTPLGKLNLGWNPLSIAWSLAKTPDGKAEGVRSAIPHQCNSYYPAAALASRAEGTTTVNFTITAEGRIADPVVTQSSGNTDLDTAALTCIRTWHYHPAVENNVPVASPWTAKIAWQAPPSDAAAPLH